MTIAIVWFRQDLRLIDNFAFIEACNHHEFVIPLYIYDKETSVLGQAQAWWLHHSLTTLTKTLQSYGLTLVLRQGNSLQIITELTKALSVDTIYLNRCYEPRALERDKKIEANLLPRGIKVKSFNSSFLIEPWAIKNKHGDYFKVFTPFWKHCLQLIRMPSSLEITNHPKKLDVLSETLSEWGLLPKLNWASRFKDYWQPGEQGAQKKLDEFIDKHLKGYKKNRDFPAKNATSRLSPHLHFGEISPWALWRAVELEKLNPICDLSSVEHFMSELGWREYSMYLLYHFPKLNQDNFRKEFDAFAWRRVDESFLIQWKEGATGYPIVDAGMRELWATGYMHNRVRMIVASFLTKDLLINWRLGADWFLDTLVDADLANNSTGWQWVAGSGADAAPYFRIFNPLLQSQKFDPNGEYIRQWVPELALMKNQDIHQPWGKEGSKNYPKPIIDHNEARNRALDYYKKLKKRL
ncbi:MAG: deoxyribodipyrimidine photo-lyase [Tatlockia sp.]|nr:deoxyribodipyrimidine photo-lyase [Tatlockia sp.]